MTRRQRRRHTKALLAWGGLAVSAAAWTLPAEERIRPVASTDLGRAAHTMTTLSDGSVLIFGGFGAPTGRGALPLRFDPIRSRFEPLGGDYRSRHSHTATLLEDGTVLIVGGYGPDGSYLRSAEVLDPQSGLSRPIPDLREARAGHVATVLPDGRVLFSGGVGEGWTFLASAEVYDPESGLFESAGEMAVARESHTAVLLEDGRVLIAGGHGGSRRNLEILRSAEIFDPRTGGFRLAGPMTIPRHKHDAVRLPDGRVLVLGGSDERDSEGSYRSTELFDPTSDRFDLHRPMNQRRYKLRGTTLPLGDGRFLLAGGAERPEIYDAASQRFLPFATPERLTGFFSAAASLPGGRILITGGYGPGPPPAAEAWMYEPS